MHGSCTTDKKKKIFESTSEYTILKMVLRCNWGRFGLLLRYNICARRMVVCSPRLPFLKLAGAEEGIGGRALLLFSLSFFVCGNSLSTALLVIFG